MTNLFNYIDRPSVVHRLTGATKLVCMLSWCFAAMTTFNTPLLAVMTVSGVLLFQLSKISFRDVWVMLTATLAFMLMNNVMIYIFSPEHGTTLYGTRTVLLSILGPYTVTAEQLFYHLNVTLKYLASIPMILLFVCTTNPSEFAASLNRIGVSYKISYAVALALRYIPDIQREFRDISLAQQARGTEMSSKTSLVNRLKAASSILIPLILSSMERIETISNAMELRGFGKGKNRTWYSARKFSAMDFVSMGICIGLMLLSLGITWATGSRYFNPFI